MEPPTPTESPGADNDENNGINGVKEGGETAKPAPPVPTESFGDSSAVTERTDNRGGAPQAQEDPARQSSELSDGEMVDCKLSPLDVNNQRQSLKSSLMSDAPIAPPPLHEESTGGGGGGGGLMADESESALHKDEYSQYMNDGGDGQLHNPNNHESALASNNDQMSSNNNDSGNNNSRLNNPFKARKKNRLVPGAGSKKGCSHPRKSPYRSEVARLRHAQQLEREQNKNSSNNNSNSNKDPPDIETSSTTSSNTKKSLSIKDTTAPPETAYFSIQSAKFKHSLLNSLGEFLTSAFADDEEASGSYFSQDLLDQLSDSNPHLKGVWLQAKSLNDSHVRQLCDALLRNKVVTEVWLPSNAITDVGAGYIAHMLKFNHTIRELFLGENDIGPKGAAALAGALARGNTTLVALGLGNNHIGVEGAGAFAAALRHNHSLHTLDIKNNGIPKKSSIRGLLNKMLEFNSSDPGDESLVLGLQEELANLVSTLPPDMAEHVVLQAEEALKNAMLCRKRGDKVGAAEAEGVFIRICTTGEPPVDPPAGDGSGGGSKPRGMRKKRSTGSGKTKKPIDPDQSDAEDEVNAEMSTLKVKDGVDGGKSADEEGKVGGESNGDETAATAEEGNTDEVGSEQEVSQRGDGDEAAEEKAESEGNKSDNGDEGSENIKKEEEADTAVSTEE